MKILEYIFTLLSVFFLGMAVSFMIIGNDHDKTVAKYKELYAKYDKLHKEYIKSEYNVLKKRYNNLKDCVERK